MPLTDPSQQCRLVTPLSRYGHDSHLQEQLDATEAPCDYCNVNVITAKKYAVIESRK